MTTASSDNKRLKDIKTSIVLLAKDLDGSSSASIISMKHPGSGENTKFLLNKTNKTIQEIQTFSEPHRSWLINDTIRTNGNLYISTPIDPLFIVLPYLKEHCNTRAIPLDHLLATDADTRLEDLSICLTDLNPIADLKGDKSLMAYKYNEEKALNWLKTKTLRLAEYFKDKKQYVKTGSVSATFVTSSLNENNVDFDSYLQFAFEIVKEYLNNDFSELLRKHLDIKLDEVSNVKRKLTEDEKDSCKKPKLSSFGFGLNTSHTTENGNKIKEETKVTKQTPKDKQRQKAAIGSKSISSFFTKK